MKNKKKWSFASITTALVFCGTLVGCNKGSGTTTTPYIGIYGADDLNYKILCEDKENNLQYGKKVTIEFTPKELEKDTVKSALGLKYYTSLNEMYHKYSETTSLATKPYVGYGNKTYHPYSYRLTEGLSYTWEVKDKETAPDTYILTIPAANFKKNLIVSFDDSLWTLEKLSGEAGTNYPYFSNDKDDGYEGERYCGINSYDIQDLVDPYVLEAPTGTSGRFDLSHYTYYDKRTGEYKTLDSYRIDEEGPTLVLEKNNYKFSTLENIGTSNFKITVLDSDGKTFELQDKLTYYVSFNLLYITFPWNVLYKVTEKEGKNVIERVYQETIKFEKAEASRITTFTAPQSNYYLSEFANNIHGYSELYKNEWSESPDVIDFCYDGQEEQYYEKFIDTSSHDLKEWPNISLTFTYGTNTKNVVFDKANAQTIEPFWLVGEYYKNVKYIEDSDSQWCITYAAVYGDEAGAQFNRHILKLVPKSYLSYRYPGTNNYATFITLKFSEPTI